MKRCKLFARALAVVLLVSDLRSEPKAAAAEPAVSPAVLPPAAMPRLSSPQLLHTAYLALVKQSIVPAAPRVVAAAALAAIAATAPERALPLPAGFGADAERDAAWLAECVRELPPPWAAIDAMVRATGTAHVGFATPERRKGMGARITGQPLSAPGFNFYPLADGRLVVFDVVKGASADASGLRLGDVLRGINGVPAIRLDHMLMHALPAGSELRLDLERENRPLAITLRLVQAEVSPVESRLLEEGIAYVQIRWFARSADAERDTASLARRAITALAAQGARGLILDLRSALGGAGEVSIISALCDSDVAYLIQQPVTAPARPVKREGARIWPDQPIVILVNEHTVSAGEALALAVRELAHAKIAGQTTAGGLTEFSFIPLADGHALTVPTGVVLGPVTGNDQPGHAVKPDIEVAGSEIAELMSGRDRQLAAALTALGRGR